MAIKIALAGATGWAGSAIAQAICQHGDLQLVSAIAREQKDKNLGSLLNIPNCNITITDSVSAALVDSVDVLIDFTHPSVAKNNIMTALERGVHVVVGTSGLSDEDYRDIEREANFKNLGVIAAGNFSITAVLLQKFATIAAKYIPHWEIIDYASAAKPDAPSGTVLELAYRLAQVAKPQVEIPVENTLGYKAARGATINYSQIHSLRLPGHILGVDAIFGMPDEKLILKHEAGSSAAPYVNGVLLASREVIKQRGLLRGLDHLIS